MDEPASSQPTKRMHSLCRITATNDVIAINAFWDRRVVHRVSIMITEDEVIRVGIIVVNNCDFSLKIYGSKINFLSNRLMSQWPQQFSPSL